jgi:hypothetical protein
MHLYLSTHSLERPMNLRDWQKKAWDKTIFFAKEKSKLYSKPVADGIYEGIILGHNHSSTEIDLLLQIIEKQSEALKKLTECNWPKDISSCAGLDANSTFLLGNIELAEQTQSEVQGLVEKITGEK